MRLERTYSEIILLPTFNERYEYLRLDGDVGKETFGFDRYVNQKFYKSSEWKSIRDFIIVRDEGRDLGVNDHEIFGRIHIHHMNPILLYDITHMSKYVLDPEYLICVSHETHNAIHYGDASLLMLDPIERAPNDTCPWRR